MTPINKLQTGTRKELIAYQDTLLMIFLRALSEIRPDLQVENRASISGGLFIQTVGGDLTSEDLQDVNAMMHKLADENACITRTVEPRDEAIRTMKRIGREDLASLIARLDADDVVKIYELDGYTDVFYSDLADNAGEVEVHDALKYRHGLLLKFPHSENPEKLIGDTSAILYHALHEQALWNGMLGVRYMYDLNDITSSDKLKDTILLSEALHDKRIVQMADEIVRNNKRIILILGPSSSGKTTFAKKLSLQLKVDGKEPLYLSTDDYFLEREETPRDENGKYDFESVNAIDIKLFTEQIEDLLAGKEVDIPTFDFLQGAKVFGKRKTRLTGDDPIIIEGIHAFNPALIGELDEDSEYKIYISPLTQMNLTMHNRIPATDIRLVRRMVRDARTRNHSAADTIRGWVDVRKGEEENIFPYSNQADIFFNTVQVHEVAVLKKHALPLLATIGVDEPEYEEADRLIRMFKYVDDIMDEDLIERDSIIREFIGGSIFE